MFAILFNKSFEKGKDFSFLLNTQYIVQVWNIVKKDHTKVKKPHTTSHGWNLCYHMAPTTMNIEHPT